MDNKHTSMSRFSKLRDDYDKFREDKQFNQENIQNEQLMSPEEYEFYNRGNIGSSSRADASRNFSNQFQDNPGNFGNLNEYQRHESGVPINNYTFNIHKNISSNSITALDKHKNFMSSISSKYIDDVDVGGVVNYGFGQIGDKLTEWYNEFTDNLEKWDNSQKDSKPLPNDQRNNSYLQSLNSEFEQQLKVSEQYTPNIQISYNNDSEREIVQNIKNSNNNRGKLADFDGDVFNIFVENSSNIPLSKNKKQKEKEVYTVTSDNDFEKEIFQATTHQGIDNYRKSIDFEGNIVFNLPRKYKRQLYKLEEYANGFQSVNQLPEKYKFDKLVNNYRHIREKLLGNNLPLEQQNPEFLNIIYTNILNGAEHMMLNNEELIEHIKGYINDLTILITLDNQNNKIINRLNDFDLNLFNDLDIDKSSEFSRFEHKYYYLNKLTSHRYGFINSKYNNVVDDFINQNGIKYNKKDLKSNFTISNLHNSIRFFEVLKTKHIINPIDNKKYISFFDYDHYAILPYDDTKDYTNMTIINKADMSIKVNNLKFKQIPDKINDDELEIFEHMNNLKRLENVKNKLDKEDIELINSYPNDDRYYTSEQYHWDDIYKINYKPLIYMALKRDQTFLNKPHKNIETEAIEVLEKYAKSHSSINESDKKLLETLSSENKSLSQKLTKAIEDKNIGEALRVSTYMKDKKMSYIRNKNALKELREYATNKLKDSNWNERNLYVEFVKTLRDLSENKATL